jgi:hypothetical protein
MDKDKNQTSCVYACVCACVFVCSYCVSQDQPAGWETRQLCGPHNLRVQALGRAEGRLAPQVNHTGFCRKTATPQLPQPTLGLELPGEAAAEGLEERSLGS